VTLEYLPLLKVQRDLYDLPRGIERFREYIQTMTGGGDELKLPLVAMNPMGKGHLPPFLDHLLAIDADDVGARALADASSALADEPGDYRACLVVSDDLKGGWTNRYASEYSYRFEQRAMYRRAWLPAILWTSETYDVALVREEVQQCVYRAVHVQRHGAARTLREMLTQESYAMRSASTCPRPITRRSLLRSLAMRPLASSDISRSDSLRAPALRSQRRDSDLSMLAMI